jgi:hypothetical protein
MAVVSIDSVHVPGSTTEIRKDEVSDLAADVAAVKLMQWRRVYVAYRASLTSDKMDGGSKIRPYYSPLNG